LPVRSGAADLQKAVDKIVAQTFCDFGLITINDGSSDATAAMPVCWKPSDQAVSSG
jgi:glycosyltransferase involved in cell wall biosynthesis